MKQNDFIYVYPNALSDDFCDQLIQKFNSDKKVKPGQTGSGVDTSKKDSMDLVISNQPDWKAEVNQLSHAFLAGLIPYVRQYPFLLIGGTSMSMVDPVSKEPVLINHEHIAQMNDEQIANMIRALYRLGNVNMQKYKKAQGGYHHWHSEVYPHPNDPQSETLHRVLLWMYYLNDVEDGGETSFYFQDTHVKPKKGTLVVAPAGFTHTHKGQIPKSDDKYILTSWLLFRRAEQLYPAGK